MLQRDTELYIKAQEELPEKQRRERLEVRDKMEQKTREAERLSATSTGKSHMHERNKAEQAKLHFQKMWNNKFLSNINARTTRICSIYS